jgi:hypothetical protein
MSAKSSIKSVQDLANKRKAEIVKKKTFDNVNVLRGAAELKIDRTLKHKKQMRFANKSSVQGQLKGRGKKPKNKEMLTLADITYEELSPADIVASTKDTSVFYDAKARVRGVMLLKKNEYDYETTAKQIGITLKEMKRWYDQTAMPLKDLAEIIRIEEEAAYQMAALEVSFDIA